ncbi:MAG: endonuclease MutS2 [Lachnospiraceae bacterium]|nr:endonuclease MutS2 [Lachnospiraceae bacterium]
MNEKVLHTLEYDKIIDMLTEQASSPLGKAKCAKILPLNDLKRIEHLQEETEDAVSRVLRLGRISFTGVKDLYYGIHSLTLGVALSQSELLNIAGLCECSARVRKYGEKPNEDEKDDSLTGFFERIEPLTALEKEIRRCIVSEEEIADDASSELKKIRRAQVNCGEKIHTQLNKMVSTTYRTYLQDAVITMRNNRYCIPVKSEYKSQVSGMVHDQSKAGSTFFIEPAQIVELNNELQELELKEKEEIEKILAGLSALAAEHADELKTNLDTCATLDFIFAKANLALKMNASRPAFNKDGIIDMKKARHPLIDARKIVPINIKLGDGYDLLIVTGPNTGGKTVSLKTTGLLSLMGQAGLHIPAGSGSMLSVFNEIFADIGDEQSIEQSLSTFSAHMTNIVSILNKANEKSLCLFDELCSGTDPTEGAALAIAILKNLKDRGTKVMATTHYSELKVFALSSPFVENACCEFDVETLSPTYRLLIGIPGKSNAFAISSKLGLSADIIEQAGSELTETQESFEDLLKNLEESRVAIEKSRIEAENYRKEVEELKKRIDEKSNKLEETRKQILKEANEEAREILEEAKETADRAIRDINKNSSVKEMEISRSKLRDNISKRNEALRMEKKTEAHKELTAKDISVGDSVRIVSMGLKGTITTMPDAKGNLSVMCGIINTKANIKDIVLEETEPEGIASARRTYYGAGLSKASSISPELNIIGKKADEAIPILEKYLDDAYISHLSSVRIVHGKGSGVLRDIVRNHVRNLKYVKSYRAGEYGEGDAGVTIVEFK